MIESLIIGYGLMGIITLGLALAYFEDRHEYSLRAVLEYVIFIVFLWPLALLVMMAILLASYIRHRRKKWK